MGVNPKKIANSILCSSNLKFPMYKGHYMTGKDISLFANLACIENTLNTFTCNVKKACHRIKNM